MQPYDKYPEFVVNGIQEAWGNPRQNLVVLDEEPYGRIIHGDTIADLVSQIDESERLLTALELVEIRLALYRVLCKKVPDLSKITTHNFKHPSSIHSHGVTTLCFDENRVRIGGTVMEIIRCERRQFEPWLQDVMTDTYMVTHQGKVFVGHGDFFDSRSQQSKLFSGEVKDGGITCPPDIIDRIIRSETVSSFPVADYAGRARGGTFGVRDFSVHPHAVSVIGAGNAKAAIEYLNTHKDLAHVVTLSHDALATWQTARGEGQMRMLCLGGVCNPGEAIYPRNTSTLGCEGIAVQKSMDVTSFLTQKEGKGIIISNQSLA